MVRIRWLVERRDLGAKVGEEKDMIDETLAERFVNTKLAMYSKKEKVVDRQQRQSVKKGGAAKK